MTRGVGGPRSQPRVVTKQVESKPSKVASETKTEKAQSSEHKEAKKLTPEQQKVAKGRKMLSAEMKAMPLKQSIKEKLGDKADPHKTLVKTTGHRQNLGADVKAPYKHSTVLASGGKSIPKPMETDPKTSKFAVRNELNSLMTGFLDSAKATRHYHAARTRNLDGETGILKQGLQPRFGGTGAAKGSADMKEQSKGKVHVTSNPGRATEYRELFRTGVMPSDKTKTTEPSEAEILKLNLKKKQVDSKTKDPHDPYQAYTLEKGIDPKYIRRDKHADLGKLDAREHTLKGKAENERS